MSERRITGSQPDFVAAALFIGAGLLALFEIRSLPVGELQDMGPAYFPRFLAILLIAIGAVIGINGVKAPAVGLGRINLRSLLMIVFAVGIFAAAVQPLGYIPAATLLIGISSFADPEARWKQVAISIIVLVTFTALIFITGLGVQLKLLGSF